MTCTDYALLHHYRNYTNVYIGIGNTCMYEGNLNSTAFNKARVAQFEEHQTSNLRDVGSIPIVGASKGTKNNWSHTNEIKHVFHQR